MNKKLPFLYDGNEITASKMGREFQMILNNERKKGMIDPDGLLSLGNTENYTEPVIDPNIRYLYGQNVSDLGTYDKTIQEADDEILSNIPKTEESSVQKYINFMSPLKIDQNIYDETVDNETDLPQDGKLLAAKDIKSFENAQALDVALIKSRLALQKASSVPYNTQSDISNFYNDRLRKNGMITDETNKNQPRISYETLKKIYNLLQGGGGRDNSNIDREEVLRNIRNNPRIGNLIMNAIPYVQPAEPARMVNYNPADDLINM